MFTRLGCSCSFHRLATVDQRTSPPPRSFFYQNPLQRPTLPAKPKPKPKWAHRETTKTTRMGEEKPPEPPSDNFQNHPETSHAGGEDKLRRSIQLISSLVSESHCIRVFSVKWQMIRVKLEELHTGLIAAESCHSTTTEENQTLSDLISSIILSVNECWDLARRCIKVSYSGKLLMQSDLDLVCAKLDAHIKILRGIYTAGILSNGSAIIVLRPGSGASRDDMRFYVRDLLTRLKIGSIEMKKQALISLNGVVIEDDRYVRIVVEMSGMLILLANSVDSKESDVQEEAAKLVSVIAGFDSFKLLLIGAGIIAPLIRVLECGSCKGKESAIKCLMKLTENGDNAWSLSAHGGVTALLNICSNGESMDDGLVLVGPACGVLRNLVGVEEIKRFMIEEGAILTFIKLVRSRDESTQISSIEFLQAMASGDESTGQMIIRQGGIREVIRVFDPKSSWSSYKSRETALRAIENMCLNSLSLLVNSGFMDQLLYFVRRGDTPIQELSLKAAFRLSGVSEEAKKAMGDAGFIPEFVKFLEAKSYDVREMVAEAISSMVMVPKNRKKFMQEEKNICLILHLIDLQLHEGNSGNLKFLLSTLLSLSSCSSARKKIINSGYMKTIEKLAGDGVSDAKKIVSNLSTNKFHAMLNRMLLHS
ncbi:hypothetical protein Dimus_032808 [Dionaea muscipula]